MCHSVHLSRLRLAATISLFAFTLMAVQAARSQTLTVLHNFTGKGDGYRPSTGVTLDRAGNLYGTTVGGGGTVFKLSHWGSGWVLTTLFSFTQQSQGLSPGSDVVFGPDGALYGTTSVGGTGGCMDGCGVVFKLQPPILVCKSILCPWTETVLYGFTGGADGASPGTGDLRFDHSGSIYGTTTGGGLNQLCRGGCGVVFKLTPSGGSWTESVLYSFTGGGDGAIPESGVIFDSAGNLYGTAYGAGSGSSGTVYELMPSGSGWLETTLHSFQRQSDGGLPMVGLSFDSSGNLYGMTSTGGSGGGGTVFSLLPSGGSWSFSVLYAFSTLVQPTGSLIIDTNGNLYGLTNSGGTFGFGSVFKLTRSGNGWMYTSLHDFTGGSDGGFPFGNLTVDTSGNFYGTTFSGGTGGDGVVWEVTP
jgi:uncharacterized repeat protein (TIGR03803 family)